MDYLHDNKNVLTDDLTLIPRITSLDPLIPVLLGPQQ